MAGYDGNGTFTKSIYWIDDLANSIPVDASRHDTIDDEFISGFDLCYLRDGQAIATANHPMGGFKHTNVANAVARDEYLTQGQFQDNAGQYFVSTGSANAYILNPLPAITSYSAGQNFIFKANFSNTDAVTINVSALGAKDVYYGNTVLSGNEILNDQLVSITYDGTRFNIMSPINIDALYGQAILQTQIFN